RLVADDSHWMSAETGEAADDVLGPVLVHLEKVAVVDDAPDHLVHVVRLVRIVRDERIEVRLLAAAGVGRLRERRRIEIVLREEGQEVARVLETRLLVARDE